MTLLEQQPIVQKCAELFLVAPRDLTGRYRFDFVMRAQWYYERDSVFASKVTQLSLIRVE